MRSSKETVVFTVVRLIAVGLLLWAYAEHPYEWYTSLRIMICATCVYGAYYAMKAEKTPWICGMVVFAVVFNPIMPLFLKRWHWWVIDGLAAAFLVLSVFLLRPSRSATDDSERADSGGEARRESKKLLFLGIALVLGGCLWWGHMLRDELNDLALLRRAQHTPGFIIDAWEEVDDADSGEHLWSNGATYTYRLPDGREFTQATSSLGRLKDEFVDLRQPYPITVEYLSEDPSVSRLKGSGSQNVLEWARHLACVSTLIALVPVCIGAALITDGMRDLKKWRRLYGQRTPHARKVENDSANSPGVS